MHRFSALFFFLLFLPHITHSTVFQDTTFVAQQDSLATSPVDTTRFRFLPGMGSIHQQIDSTRILHNAQFDWTDTKYVGDLLWKIPGYYLSRLGEAGKLHQFTAFGLDWRGIPILLDGRPINNPYSNAVNLYDIPLESIEQVETLDGIDAVMFGGQGVALNLVTRQYNTNRPITKLRYVQGPFEYGLTDALFTQNVARGTNVMVGLQRHVSDGRFRNAAYDSWHLRSQVRYNYSDRFNIALSHFYYSSDNGLNSGIDSTSPSFFSEVTAVVRNEVTSESNSRHDLTLTGMALPFRDSASTMQFSLFYSEIERIYRDTALILPEQTGSSIFGSRITQRFSSGLLRSMVGFEIQRQQNLYRKFDIWSDPKDITALFIKSDLHLVDAVVPSALVKVEKVGTRSEMAYAFGITTAVNHAIKLRGEYSLTHRFATFQERERFDSVIVISSSGMETHRTLRITFDARLGSMGTVSLSGYRRTVSGVPEYPTFTRPNSSLYLDARPPTKIYGLTTALTLRLGKIESFTTGIFSEASRHSSPVTLTPKWRITGELAYRDIVLKDVLELRTGVRYRYISSHRGMQFIPRYGLYVENPGSPIDQSFTFDFFAVAHLGNAYLTVGWENLFDEEYVTVAGYPMPGRTFRFGFNWTFID